MNRESLSYGRASLIYHKGTGRGSTEYGWNSYKTYRNYILLFPIQHHARKLISQGALGGKAAGWDEFDEESRMTEMFEKVVGRGQEVILHIHIQQDVRKLMLGQFCEANIVGYYTNAMKISTGKCLLSLERRLMRRVRECWNCPVGVRI